MPKRIRNRRRNYAILAGLFLGLLGLFIIGAILLNALADPQVAIAALQRNGFRDIVLDPGYDVIGPPCRKGMSLFQQKFHARETGGTVVRGTVCGNIQGVREVVVR